MPIKRGAKFGCRRRRIRGRAARSRRWIGDREGMLPPKGPVGGRGKPTANTQQLTATRTRAKNDRAATLVAARGRVGNSRPGPSENARQNHAAILVSSSVDAAKAASKALTN